MCPACIGSAALMVGSLVSTGGLTGFIVTVFHSKKSAKVHVDYFRDTIKI